MGSPARAADDGHACETSRRCWALLAPELETILRDFHEELRNSAQGYLFTNTDTERLVAVQIGHWRALFTSDMPHQASARITRMHLRHKEIGLTSSQYVRAYLELLCRFHAVVLGKSASLEEGSMMVQTINAVVLADISLALQAYHEVLLVD